MMKALVMIFTIYIVIGTLIHISTCIGEDVWEKVPCDADFTPENCDFQKLPVVTVEDFERCGPAKLNRTARNFFLGAAGRRITYNDNKQAFKRIRIVPKMLRDVSETSLEITTLGYQMSFPIGFSPVAWQTLAHPQGEVATARAIAGLDIVMVLSDYSGISMEEFAANAYMLHLWMEVHIFKNRTLTIDLVRRAERAGFEAIVVTLDGAIRDILTCDTRAELADLDLVNLKGYKDGEDLIDPSSTFKDITWLRNITKLPVIAKGILSASDAVLAIDAGANAIFVSNHGGRLLDSSPATIDVLPDIVAAVNNMRPRRDVYVDGGIRNGWDVYKAIASGAKMVFVGRPQIWGLAKEVDTGARLLLNILRREFERAMILSGAANPSQIGNDTLIKIC